MKQEELFSIAAVPAVLCLAAVFALGYLAGKVAKGRWGLVAGTMVLSFPFLCIASVVFETFSYPHFVTTMENEVAVFARDTEVAVLSFALITVAFGFGIAWSTAKRLGRKR